MSQPRDGPNEQVLKKIRLAFPLGGSENSVCAHMGGVDLTRTPDKAFPRNPLRRLIIIKRKVCSVQLSGHMVHLTVVSLLHREKSPATCRQHPCGSRSPSGCGAPPQSYCNTPTTALTRRGVVNIYHFIPLHGHGLTFVPWFIAHRHLAVNTAQRMGRWCRGIN
jgi:hypothetical protein